jgi:hypothetical protein
MSTGSDGSAAPSRGEPVRASLVPAQRGLGTKPQGGAVCALRLAEEGSLRSYVEEAFPAPAMMRGFQIEREGFCPANQHLALAKE